MLALPPYHQHQHPILLPLGNAQLVAMLAESPLTQDLTEARLDVTRLPTRGALRGSGTDRERYSSALHHSACAPIDGRGARPGKEIPGGGLGELPKVATDRSGATSEENQQAPIAAQDRVSDEAAGGRKPLRAIGRGSAEKAKCRLGELGQSRRAMPKEVGSCPRRMLAFLCSVQGSVSEKRRRAPPARSSDGLGAELAANNGPLLS